MQHTADERGKVFVGGLSWDTNNCSMLKYFSKYGEVIDCVVMKNPDTGKSRGFGFVTFKDVNCVDMVLSTKHHVLDGRQIDPKACNPRSMNKGSKSLENSKRKIFIGGLPVNITEQQLAELFKQYGPVEEVVIMLDQHKQRSRGFGFLTFEEEESVDKVVKEHFIQVNGKQVEVKRAEPRDLKLLNDHSSSTTTPITPYALNSILLAPSSHTSLPLLQLPAPFVPSPFGVIDPVFNPPWNSTTQPGVQLINSTSPIVFIADASNTPIAYQLWAPPSIPDLPFIGHHDPITANNTNAAAFASEPCSVIVLPDAGTPLSSVKDSKSVVDLNNNSNNNYDHIEHHNTFTNNNIQIINNNNNNNLQSPLFALHPSVRNHSTTVPAFHPYRR